MVNLFLTESDLKPQKLSRILFRTMAILLDSDLFRPLVSRCKIATTRNVSIKKDVMYFHALSYRLCTFMHEFKVQRFYSKVPTRKSFKLNASLME